MQRLRLSSNVHFGLALGIATAGVILALTGCAVTTGGAQPTTASAESAKAADLTQFSADEQSRILAVQEIVAEAAAKHELDPALLNAMIWVESRFDPKAKSPSGARGLMQLMPATAAYLAKRMGEQNAHAYDPSFNIQAGALYLAEMQNKFGDEQLAVAAYHAGPGNVKKWVEAGQPFPEYSDAYVAKVMDARARFTGVETHGRSSGARTPVIAPGPSKTEPAEQAKHAPLPIENSDEPSDEWGDLEVPDVASLPDAAEIHGVERVVYERPEPEPEPDWEPVFEVHPELDRSPATLPRGWQTRPPARPRVASQTRTPSQGHAPAPVQSQPRTQATRPTASKSKADEVGLGVLPDL